MNDSARRLSIQVTIILLGVAFLIKLFSLQVLDPTYQLAAENNVVERVIKYPYRGLIYDRNGKLIVYNEPVYDLEVIPKEVIIEDTLSFCQVFGLTRQEFEEKMMKAKKYSSVKPSIFIKQISNKDFAAVQDFLIDYPGFRIQSRSDRGYAPQRAGQCAGLYWRNQQGAAQARFYAHPLPAGRLYRHQWH